MSRRRQRGGLVRARDGHRGRRRPGAGHRGVVPERVRELFHALDAQGRSRTVAAVQKLFERRSRVRAPVREQPPRDVRVALVRDAVVFIRREADPLEHGERPQDVPKVRRNLEDVPVLLLDAFEVARELRDFAVRAAARLQELLSPHFHVLHALELFPNLLDLLLVR